MMELSRIDVASAIYILKRMRKQDREFYANRKQLLEDVANSDGGCVIKKDGQPIAMLVGKRNPLHDDMIHAWAVMTDAARGHAKGLLRLTRKGIEDECNRLGAKLCITFCREDLQDQHKWVQAVGFKPAPEGDHKVNGYTMKGYCYGIRRQVQKGVQEAQE